MKKHGATNRNCSAHESRQTLNDGCLLLTAPYKNRLRIPRPSNPSDCYCLGTLILGTYVAQDHESAYKNYLLLRPPRHCPRSRVGRKPQVLRGLQALVICQ
jgi:hypothetical protein